MQVKFGFETEDKRAKQAFPEERECDWKQKEYLHS